MNSTPLWVLPEDLAQIQLEDPELIETILESFGEQVLLSLAELDDCVARADSARAERAIHKFKGALLQIGAPSVAASCQDFRSVLPSETPSQWSARLNSIRSDCQQILSEIGRFRNAG